MIAAEFSYTVEDLREAANAHAQAHAQVEDSKVSGGYIGAHVTAILALLLGLLVLKTMIARRGAGAGFALLPMAAVAALIFISLAVIVRKTFQRRKSVAPPLEVQIQSIQRFPLKKALVWIAGIMIAVPIATYVYMRQDSSPSTPASPPPTPSANPALDTLAVFFPWVMVAAFIFFFIRLRMRSSSPETIIQKNPSLELRKRLEADAQRLVIDDTESRVELSWSAVRRFVETPNLFLLYLANDSFHMIPKRGFAGGDIDAFRELLRSSIQPVTRAFPVLPVNA